MKIPHVVEAEIINGDTVRLIYRNPYLEDQEVACVQRERVGPAMVYSIFRAAGTGDDPTDELLLTWAARTFRDQLSRNEAPK